MDIKTQFRSMMPHIIAVFIFLVLTFIFLFPILEGKQMAQHDDVQSLAMQREIKDHLEKTGELTLWTNTMFGGMPVYQIWMQYPGNLLSNFIYFMRWLLPGVSELVFLF